MRPRLLFWVLDILHSQAPQTDFHAKYVKRRGSAQGRAFWGLDNKNLTFRLSFPPKIAIFGPHFYGLGKFSAENRFTMGMLESKLPLIFIVAP